MMPRVTSVGLRRLGGWPPSLPLFPLRIPLHGYVVVLGLVPPSSQSWLAALVGCGWCDPSDWTWLMPFQGVPLPMTCCHEPLSCFWVGGGGGWETNESDPYMGENTSCSCNLH